METQLPQFKPIQSKNQPNLSQKIPFTTQSLIPPLHSKIKIPNMIKMTSSPESVSTPSPAQESVPTPSPVQESVPIPSPAQESVPIPQDYCPNKSKSEKSKSEKSKSGMSISEKFPCSGGCAKTFTKSTLDKYGGKCWRCDRKSKKSEEKSGSCSRCGKTFTSKTLKKYGGSCGRCAAIMGQTNTSRKSSNIKVTQPTLDKHDKTGKTDSNESVPSSDDEKTEEDSY